MGYPSCPGEDGVHPHLGQSKMGFPQSRTGNAWTGYGTGGTALVFFRKRTFLFLDKESCNFCYVVTET